MRVLNRYTSYRRYDDDPSYHVEVVERPAHRVLIHAAFHLYAEPILRRFAPAIDKVREPLHKRHCNDDCTTMYSNDEHRTPTKVCGQWPFDCQLDLTCYDLGHDYPETVVHHFELNETTYEALGSKLE